MMLRMGEFVMMMDEVIYGLAMTEYYTQLSAGQYAEAEMTKINYFKGMN
jgi:hypothetical protein